MKFDGEEEFDYDEDLILLEALRIVAGPRRRDYDAPEPNHDRIARIWNVQIEKKLKQALDPRDVALMMIGVKLAREAYTRKNDNIVDIAGYAQCVQFIDRPKLIEKFSSKVKGFFQNLALMGGDNA